MRSRPFALALALLVGLIGCSDDNGGTAPPTTGTVLISPQPEGIDAAWEITGPDGYSAENSGAAELTGRAPGDYTVAWGAVDDHETPDGETLHLAAGRTITFMGLYTETEGPIPQPGFVYIPPGTFTMGSPEDEPWRWHTEGPQHQVTLTQGFYMSKYEVTEEWWYQVMGGEPTTSQLPKNYVSWDLAVQFCNALSAQEGLTPVYTIHGPNGNVTWHQGANGYRLPTEAEWEYACRATTTMAYHNDTNCLDSTTEANFYGIAYQLPGCPLGIYRDARTEVGSFPANGWGLYDMHGNLWEWVWCGLRTYTSSPQVDPVHNAGPTAFRVFRGGGWHYSAQYCRSAVRYRYFVPDDVLLYYGFRPVRSAP